MINIEGNKRTTLKISLEKSNLHIEVGFLTETDFMLTMGPLLQAIYREMNLQNEKDIFTGVNKLIEQCYKEVLDNISSDLEMEHISYINPEDRILVHVTMEGNQPEHKINFHTQELEPVLRIIFKEIIRNSNGPYEATKQHLLFTNDKAHNFHLQDSMVQKTAEEEVVYIDVGYSNSKSGLYVETNIQSFNLDFVFGLLMVKIYEQIKSQKLDLDVGHEIITAALDRISELLINGGSYPHPELSLNEDRTFIRMRTLKNQENELGIEFKIGFTEDEFKIAMELILFDLFTNIETDEEILYTKEQLEVLSKSSLVVVREGLISEEE